MIYLPPLILLRSKTLGTLTSGIVALFLEIGPKRARGPTRKMRVTIRSYVLKIVFPVQALNCSLKKQSP
tara:strand:+ start:190 stop:396 length:207 start_codon:yes stop_codon:yes gene_type:complete